METLEQQIEQIRGAKAKSIRSKAKVRDVLPFFKCVDLTGYPGDKADGPDRREWLIDKLRKLTKAGGMFGSSSALLGPDNLAYFVQT